MEGGGEGGDGEEGERSDEIGRDLGVENITLKAAQARLRWYGDILRMDEGNKVKQNIKVEVRGTGAKGRPRIMWMDNIRHDMDKYGLKEGEAQDQRQWRRIVQNQDLAS